MLAYKQPSFKESVTAHSHRDLAPKMIGAKRGTEDAGLRQLPTSSFQLPTECKCIFVVCWRLAVGSCVSGRRAFQSAVKVKGRPILERLEVKMLARVTAMHVRFMHAERSRFPSQ